MNTETLAFVLLYCFNMKNKKRRKKKEKEGVLVGCLLLLSSIFILFRFYILIREGIRFMPNGTPPRFLSNVHVLRPPEPEKMVFTNVSVCLFV